jgi:hypothetical protein
MLEMTKKLADRELIINFFELSSCSVVNLSSFGYDDVRFGTED